MVAQAGGLLHKQDLVKLGARDRDLTRAVRRGAVRRPRRGWYSTWSEDDSRFIAVRVGGRLTGLAALALHGAWSWSGRGEAPITVSVPRNAARLRRRRHVRVVHDPPEVITRGTRWSVDLRDALRRAITEASFEEAVALIDWATETGALSRSALLEVRRLLTVDARPVFEWADPRCDSFPESIARTRFRRAGHRARCQGPLRNGQRIDLVIDDVIGLEIDGFAFHADRFEEDRRKDLEIARAGLVPLRVTVAVMRSDWRTVVEAAERLLATHRGRVGRRWTGHEPPLRAVLPARGRHRSWRFGRCQRGRATPG